MDNQFSFDRGSLRRSFCARAYYKFSHCAALARIALATGYLLTLFLAWWFSCMLIFGETIIHYHRAVQKLYSKDQPPLVRRF